MSRYDFGPEVRTFCEIDCEACGWSAALTDVDEVFDEVTSHHADDYPFPRRVTVARRGKVSPGDPRHRERSRFAAQAPGGDSKFKIADFRDAKEGRTLLGPTVGGFQRVAPAFRSAPCVRV